MTLLHLLLPLALAGQGGPPDDVPAAEPARFEIRAPELVLTGVPFRLEIRALGGDGTPLEGYEGTPRLGGVLLPNGETTAAGWEEGTWAVDEAVALASGAADIYVSEGGATGRKEVRAIPGFLSVLPPLLAIVLALVFRQVVVSLFAGIWLGAFFLFDYNPVAGFFGVLDHFLVNALTDTSHVQIILFSMLFGGMVGVITRNGGARGIARLITRYARTARGGQVSTWLMALVLFFDDYANVLVRGNLMRPITDQLRISREKLAFLVDTGAATVASIFIISTWIGYEVGLIEQGLRMIDSSADAYTMFLRTIPYRFYPILALILALAIGLSGRDFGPMLAAERRARETGEVLRRGSQPAVDLTEAGASAEEDEQAPRWLNGLAPIAAVLLVGLFGLYWTGSRSLAEQGIASYRLGDVVSNADSYVALLWAALAGCVVAMGLSWTQRRADLNKVMDWWFLGLKSMLLAVIILVLAWSIGAVTEELHTADYLVQVLRGSLAPHWLPVLTFAIAAAISFATGTSWATMAIMMPLVIPLAHTLGRDVQLPGPEADTILLGVISSVLAGSVFGDHCSPISDTTILSSMSSACDHIDHVRTQLPYALLAAAVGMAVGDVPTAYGLSPWISILVGSGILILVLFTLGKRVSNTEP